MSFYDLFFFFGSKLVLNPSSSTLNCPTEEKHTRAGHQVQVLNYLILGVGLTIFCVLDHACIKSMTCKAITSYPAMSRNVTYWHSINAGNLETQLGIIGSSYILECSNAMKPLSFLCCFNLYVHVFLSLFACSSVYGWVCLHVCANCEDHKFLYLPKQVEGRAGHQIGRFRSRSCLYEFGRNLWYTQT
jgi:hypothetical protein